MKACFTLFMILVAVIFSACSPSDLLKTSDNKTTLDSTIPSQTTIQNTCRVLNGDNNSDGGDNNSDGGDNNSDGGDNNSDGGDNNSDGGDNNSDGNGQSHNFGKNCMNCHTSAGSAADEAVFTVAGSIYDTCGTTKTSGVTSVYVYPESGLAGTPVIIPVDASGNFYSTTTMTLGSTKIVSSTGIEKIMSSTPTKSCTFCHSTTGSQNKLMLD